MRIFKKKFGLQSSWILNKRKKTVNEGSPPKASYVSPHPSFKAQCEALIRSAASCAHCYTYLGWGTHSPLSFHRLSSSVFKLDVTAFTCVWILSPNCRFKKFIYVSVHIGVVLILTVGALFYKYYVSQLFRYSFFQIIFFISTYLQFITFTLQARCWNMCVTHLNSFSHPLPSPSP